MRLALFVSLAVMAASGRARADDDIGVVVTGELAMQSKVASHVQKWLAKHGHKLIDAPLSTDAVTTLANCLVIDDTKCARGVFDARSSAASLIVVDVATSGKKITFHGYWFVKGNDTIAKKKICEKCAGDDWRDAADGLLKALIRDTNAVIGNIRVLSKPSGLPVTVDGVEVGKTPLDRDLPAGAHVVAVLGDDGRVAATEKVDVDAGTTQDVELRATIAEKPSHLGPALLIGAGAVACIVGGVYLYYGSIGGPDAMIIYPGSTQVGIAFMAGGLGAAIGGSIWLATQSSEARSAPVVSVTRGGGYVGWIRRF